MIGGCVTLHNHPTLLVCGKQFRSLLVKKKRMPIQFGIGNQLRQVAPGIKYIAGLEKGTNFITLFECAYIFIFSTVYNNDSDPFNWRKFLWTRIADLLECRLKPLWFVGLNIILYVNIILAKQIVGVVGVYAVKVQIGRRRPERSSVVVGKWVLTWRRRDSTNSILALFRCVSKGSIKRSTTILFDLQLVNRFVRVHLKCCVCSRHIWRAFTTMSTLHP